ncbi:MAG TPA: hypothetical protein VNK26_06705, partial [Pyrinomonadaceae bacterium]|nr:hypothetical protein [Pyrinomonadaceae bacterium]
MPDQSSVDADKNPKAEMTACAKCGRQTPVNRLSCLYCGTLIEIVSDTGSDLKIKVPEAWQYGFNIVIRADSEIGNLPEAATNLPNEALQSLIESKAAVPIYRVGSQPEAENLSNRLKNKGIAAEIIPDLELISDKNPVRLRRIEYSDTDNCFYLTAFDSNKTQGRISLPAYEISVIVLGGWFNRVTEQKYKKRSDKDDKARDESVFEGLN